MTRSTRYSKTPPLPLLFLPLPVLHLGGAVSPGPAAAIPRPVPASIRRGGRPGKPSSPRRCPGLTGSAPLQRGTQRSPAGAGRGAGLHRHDPPPQGGAAPPAAHPRRSRAGSQRRDPPHHRDTAARGLHPSLEPAITGTPPMPGTHRYRDTPTPPDTPPSFWGPPITVTHLSSRVSPITGTSLSPPSAASPGRK